MTSCVGMKCRELRAVVPHVGICVVMRPAERPIPTVTTGTAIVVENGTLPIRASDEERVHCVGLIWKSRSMRAGVR
jgi:hypothetical protein